MSNVTSQSELTTKEIVEQAISDYHATILPYLAKGNNGYSETPIGAMQMFDDDTAPSGWLVADGTVYDIDDYPFLANHIERVHGSKNHYGGDGTTTFAVPNWQGEFFRASGTNSHTNQGSGAAVGEHQDGTILAWTGEQGSINIMTDAGAVATADSQLPSIYNRRSVTGNTASNFSAITSRPTNTSLLCCIKAVPAGINYSLEEQKVGTWIDDKPLYQKTIDCGALPNATTKQIAHNITNADMMRAVDSFAFSSGNAIPIPFVTTGTIDSVSIEVQKAGNIKISCAIDYSGFSSSYVTLQYTKTTD